MKRPPTETFRVIDPATGETMALVYGTVIEQLRPHFEARGLEVIDASECRNGAVAPDRETGNAA